MDSILSTIKSMLGISEEDPSFDEEIIVHINGAFNILLQLGIGPDEGYMITGSSETWQDYMSDKPSLQMVKTYIYYKVKLVFDPPATSFVTEAINKQVTELEWRLIAQKEVVG